MEMDKAQFVEKLKALLEMGKKKKNEWALIYADYYGFHRALPYNDDNTLGFII